PGVNLKIIHRDKIIGVIGVSGKPDDVFDVARLIKVMVETIVNQKYLYRMAYYQDMQWSFWLHQLLHPSGFDKAKLEEEAFYSLGVDPNDYWRVFLLFGADAQRYVELIKKELKQIRLYPLFILPFIENEVVIAIKDNKDDHLDLNDVASRFLEMTQPLTDCLLILNLSFELCNRGSVKKRTGTYKTL